MHMSKSSLFFDLQGALGLLFFFDHLLSIVQILLNPPLQESREVNLDL